MLITLPADPSCLHPGLCRGPMTFLTHQSTAAVTDWGPAAPAWMKLSLSSIFRKQSRPMLASSALWGLLGLSTKLWISCPCSNVSTRTAGVTRGYSALGKLRLRHSLHKAQFQTLVWA